ncbi:hypothetical protein [Parvularcula sp. LCG005]|uniref:hypothetical protein n=1 Tax=Parvularcula sp. LCG005 TaxID=3078805 RepID=UPI0029421058|nr:hypothetical protein [Parvularcula sp. LCG005]WOI53282.1 hypothetical protein RUI03_14135 [Parvularcula sp. LCG005]
MKQRRINTNTVIAVAALFTSVVAVVVAWDESRLLRESQRASFMPILNIEKSVSTAPDALRIEMDIRNSGNGVAIVRSGALLLDGAPVADYDRMATATLGPDLGATADFSWTSLLGYYQPTERKEILRFKWPDTPVNRTQLETYIGEALQDNSQRLTLQVCYCSVFEECWQVRDDAYAEPVRIKTCRSHADPIDPIWQSYTATRMKRPTSGDEE